MKEFTGYKKGINLGGWLSQCKHTQTHYDTFITESDIRQISDWGLDHVRLPIDYECVQDGDGQYVESGFERIARCIDWCEKYGLNIILDLHKTAGFSFDANDNSLFGNPELEEIFLRLWDAFSLRFGKRKNVAFELLNEIVEERSELWNTLSAKAINVIRKNAPAVPIILGGVQWNSVHTLKLLEKPNDDNIVYNFHFYEPFLFTHQNASWHPLVAGTHIGYPSGMDEYRRRSKEIQCFGSGLYNTETMGAEFMEKLIQEAAEAAEKANAPLYCGEYGVIDCAEPKDTLEWYKDINSVFEKFGIGRAAWTYKGMNFGLTEDHYREVITEIIKLL